MLSVWEKDDAAWLERALAFYPSVPPQRILDCTVNRGRFWHLSRYKALVTGMDINPAVAPDLVDDNRVMAGVADASFDVVIYDPPHVPNQGKDRRKDFRERFGLGAKAGPEACYSFSGDYAPVLAQCKRVLTAAGVLFAKISDLVHNHRYQWQLLAFVQAVQASGLTPCDLVVKTRKGPIMDPKWKTRHHSRRCHCYWVVVRKGPSCERG